jgi:hypothetical protein
MSILDRLSLSRPLDDAAFAEIWAAAASGTDDAEARAHLETCSSCRGRYAAFESWLDEIGTVARTEANEAFPAERLAAQQAQIMRRLEALDRPARVILFPKQTQAMTADRSGARRWIAAAAAAGLLVGIAAGQMLDLRDAFSPSPQPFAQVRRDTAAGGGSMQPTSLAVAQSDEAFLTELEDAALSPRVPELAALDAVTPRLRDVSNERSQ